jgi:hydrogenase nickel incorporation protein HypB
MVGRLLHAESIVATQALFIENVGNLVCPAEFPLGEFRRVVLLSVTEGDDKPIKYPVIFRNCDLVIFTKCDLLEYVNFDLSAAEKNLKALNSKLKTLRVSSKTGDGIDEWINWLNNQMTEYQAQLKNEHHVHHAAH